MFSLFARRLRCTTFSAIQLCTRGIASETPSKAVLVQLLQTPGNNISHQALKEGFAARFGPVELLWLNMPSGRDCIVTFQEQAAAEALVAQRTLKIPPAGLIAQRFLGPRPAHKPRQPAVTDENEKCRRLFLYNIPTCFGVSALDLVKVFSRFGKVTVQQPTEHGYPCFYAFLYFETQEAADNALKAILSEEGLPIDLLEGFRLTSARYSPRGYVKNSA